MDIQEYVKYDGIGLADLVKNKTISPIELLETAINAVERTNLKINAVVYKMYDEAKKSITDGLPVGPFSGVPFMLKDLLADYAGVPTSAAWKLRQNYIPKQDAEYVKRVKAAGLIVIGKTALPEFANALNTESELFGFTTNPWNEKYGTGTSSGGSAAAVAAGMVPMAHGGDGGGSIRCPASVCGLVGLKPSRGRNPLGPDGDRWHGMVVEHVLTKSVRDTAAMLDATSGPEVGSFLNPAPKDRVFLDEVGADPGKLKIAWSAEAPYGANTHPDCIAALNKAIKICGDLGHELIHDTPKLPKDGFDAVQTMLMTEMAADILAEEVRLGRKLTETDFEWTWPYIVASRKVSGLDVTLAIRTMHKIARTYDEFFENYDMILTPTLANPYPPVLTPKQNSKEDYPLGEAYLKFMPYTHVFNISGQPAISLPLHWNDENMPVGIQLATRWPNEALLLRLASQIEAAAPWYGAYESLYKKLYH